MSGDASESLNGITKLLGTAAINFVVTSSENKAIETGRLLAKALDKPNFSFEGLEEHNRTGVPYLGQDDWLETLKQFFKNPNELIFGKETATEARLRFDNAIQHLLAAYPNKTLAVVSHATVMSLFIGHYNDLDAWSVWQTLKMPDMRVLTLPNFKRV